MRTNSRILMYGLLALMAMSCTGPRKALQRACAKAERHMAKAIYLCPDLLKPIVQHDTVEVLVQGGSAEGATGYTQADMDSLSKLCSELVAYAQSRASSARRELEEERRTKRTGKTTPDVVSRLRKSVCELEPVMHADSLITLKMWTEDGKLRYRYQILPRTAKAVTTHTSTQVAVQAPCPPEGVASWYRTWFWALLFSLALFLFLFGRVLYYSLRAWKPNDEG